MSRGSGKKIGSGDITGREGIHFIGLIVSRMGLLWKENAAPEAGIDGYIEIRDSVTGEVFNTYVFVQSKAGPSHFKNETDQSFDYYCKEEDIAYWTSGNVPVVLIVSRNGNEGYWISVNRYFGDPKKKDARKVTFNKSQDRFDVGSREALITHAESREAGLYLAPIPKRERLFTNILPITFGYEFVSVATTPISSEAEFERRLREKSEKGSMSAVYENSVISFDDLRGHEFRGLVDDGSIEQFDIGEMADSEFTGRFIHLLNRCLVDQLYEFGVRFHQKRELFYFESERKGKPRVFQYQSIKETAKREVVMWKEPPKKGLDGYCRHCAAEMRFRNYDGDWFLEVVPTYLFTSDGFHGHRNGKSLLKGIKLLEKNKSVVAQTLMWSDLLALDQGMFQESTPPLKFLRIIREDFPCGISDKDWRPSDEADLPQDDPQEGLFS